MFQREDTIFLLNHTTVIEIVVKMVIEFIRLVYVYSLFPKYMQ
jgi:hypothetical protein